MTAAGAAAPLVRPPLVGGPYPATACAIGDELDCTLSGRVRVVRFSVAPIAWPMGYWKKIPALCGELERAVRTERLEAVMAWWGVTRDVVYKWRKALGIVGWAQPAAVAVDLASLPPLVGNPPTPRPPVSSATGWTAPWPGAWRSRPSAPGRWCGLVATWPP